MNIVDRWINEAGSELVIEENDSSSFKGTYRTALGSPDSEEIFQAQGQMNSGLISFMVNFGSHESICCWNGYYNESSDSLECMWLLSSSDTDIPNSLRTGKSSFSRVKFKS